MFMSQSNCIYFSSSRLVWLFTLVQHLLEEVCVELYIVTYQHAAFYDAGYLCGYFMSVRSIFPLCIIVPINL